MINYNKYRNNIGFLDILMNALLIFIFLFTLAYIQIAQKLVDPVNIKTKAEFVVLVTWPDKDGNDVDTWVKDPSGSLINYLDLNEGLMHLDRDDTGKIGDTLTLPTGEKVVYDKNQEIVTIRGIIPGEWIVNVHMYRIESNPSEVTVEIVKLNPSREIIVYKKVILDTYWQEITVARLTLSDKGEVLLIDDLPAKLVYQQRGGYGWW